MSIVDDIRDALASGVSREVIRRKIVQYVRDRLHDFDFPIIIVRGPYTVIIEKAELNRAGLEIWLDVKKSGKTVSLDLPIIFTQPRLLVVDPLGDIVKTITNPQTGQSRQIRFSLDPVQSIKNELISIILSAS